MNGEENQELIAHVRKEKGRKFTKNIDRRSVSENKKDIMKIICYKYNQLGYYAKYCTQQNKKRKHYTNEVDMDESPLHKKTKET